MTLDAGRTVEQWLGVRWHLNKNRYELTGLADSLYRGHLRVDASRLLTSQTWVPPRPVLLEDIELIWSGNSGGPKVTGEEPEAWRTRPAYGERFGRYSTAVAELDKPRLFEDRPCYRLLDVDWTNGMGGRLVFGPGNYFEGYDVGEAAAHEFADVHYRGEAVPGTIETSSSALPSALR